MSTDPSVRTWALEAAPNAVRPPTDDPELSSWRAFIQAHAMLVRRLDEELQATHDLSLAEYEALLQLARAPDRRLRMSTLADRMLFSRSGVTRLVARLVDDGAVLRMSCPTDARGAEAVLTQGGLDRLRAASRTHLAGVRQYFLEVMTSDDRDAVERGLTRVTDRLGGASAPGTYGDPGQR